MVIELAIKSREDKKPNLLRREGNIPATIYGPDIDPVSIQLNRKEFSNIAYADYKHLISLKKDGEAEDIEALIRNIQKDYVSNEILNIEFYKVKRGHKITMKVDFNFVGTSEALKMGADFVTVHKTANVRVLPKHIPNNIEVDISTLENAGDLIAFKDLNIPEEIEILDPPQEIVCKAESKRVDHSKTAAPAEGEAAPAEAEAATAAPAA